MSGTIQTSLSDHFAIFMTCERSKNREYTPFFYKQSIFDPRPENCLSFSKNRPKGMFSNCLVDGLLTSIV